MNAGGRAQAVRKAIEAELADSFAGALSPRPYTERPVLPFGIPELDAACGGGAPAGAVTELVGLGSTGKTGAAMRLLAAAMRAGKVCAWVDASDAFDPATGAANGMPLPQLLWVRCGGSVRQETHVRSRAMMERAASSLQSKGTHPRDEARGMDQAVGGLFAARQAPMGAAVDTSGKDASAACLRACGYGSDHDGNRSSTDWPDASRTGMHSTRNRQSVETPGALRPLSPLKRAPHTPRPAFRSVPRSEQVAEDRVSGRSAAQAVPATAMPAKPDWGGLPLLHAPHRPWERWQQLDQALRAADLLLQGGGFAVVVLDLGSIAPEHALRIPTATWFRFRAAAEASGTAFVLMSQVPCARSSARLVLNFEPLRMQLAGGTVVETVRYGAEIVRQRAAPVHEPPRKQPKATWQASSYRGVAEHGISDPKPVRLLAPVLAWRTTGANFPAAHGAS